MPVEHVLVDLRSRVSRAIDALWDGEHAFALQLLEDAFLDCQTMVCR
jgi:hypothetical protein